MLYKLSKTVYLDTYDNDYKNIITITPKPQEPALQPYIKQINIRLYDRTNHFSNMNRDNRCNSCQYVFTNIPDIRYCNGNKDDIVLLEDFPELIIFLAGLNYTMDTTLSKSMFQNKYIVNRDFIGFLKTP